jgi:hypothetical protein
MSSQAADLARCLARDAEAVCRHYLPNGRRRGRYWVVGDVANTAGRSLFVRLTGPDSGKGAAGKWTDAATGQHGDLLDLIALNRRLERLRDVLDEARSFLSLPRPEPPPDCHRRQPPAPMGSPESARRLFAMAQPISGTIAEAYLRNRGITALHDAPALRFHPRCYYRPDADAPTEIWPALIAAVTDLSGDITGAHRTWLDPTGEDKAPVDTPRRAMGHLLGHGVRFGVVTDVMVRRGSFILNLPFASHHSITSSARASSVSGTVRLIAFAVLRLITSSYLVGACTGRSAGFSPLRMRST